MIACMLMCIIMANIPLLETCYVSTTSSDMIGTTVTEYQGIPQGKQYSVIIWQSSDNVDSGVASIYNHIVWFTSIYGM